MLSPSQPSPIELAANRILSVTTYNGQFPGPLLRFKEGERVTIDLRNETDSPEQVHWHGQFVAPDVDGAAEEGTPFIMSADFAGRANLLRVVPRVNNPVFQWSSKVVETIIQRGFGMPASLAANHKSRVNLTGLRKSVGLIFTAGATGLEPASHLVAAVKTLPLHDSSPGVEFCATLGRVPHGT
jgi:Multicopper oxidase